MTIFKRGDEVRTVKGYEGATRGTIVGINWNKEKPFIVRWPNGYLENFAEEELMLAQPEPEQALDSAWLHRHPESRHWDTSYTKTVVDLLRGVRGDLAARMVASTAADLLKQYHRDLHLPYEERDRARDCVKAQAARLREKDEELVTLREEILLLRARLHGTQARLNAKTLVRPYKIAEEPAQEKVQTYFYCKHYPFAITNFFSGRDSCEHNCHETELKWWQSGMHQEP